MSSILTTTAECDSLTFGDLCALVDDARAHGVTDDTPVGMDGRIAVALPSGRSYTRVVLPEARPPQPRQVTGGRSRRRRR